MVDALREAHRVLMPTGILIDIRPVTRPIVIEVLIDSHGVWAKTVRMDVWLWLEGISVSEFSGTSV